MRPLSEDLRKRIIEKRESGYRVSDVSSLFGVSRRTVYRIYDRYCRSGSIAALKKGKPEGSKMDEHRERLAQWIEESPGLTLEQLQQRCLEDLSVDVSITTLHRMLARWGYRYKKNSFRQRAEAS